MNLHEAHLLQEFPVKANRIFFDHAKVCPLPRRVRDAVNSFAKDACESGTKNYNAWMTEAERVREQFARLRNRITEMIISLAGVQRSKNLTIRIDEGNVVRDVRHLHGEHLL